MGFTAINKVAKEISGGIPSHYHVDLENRLGIAFGERKRHTSRGTRRSRGEHLAASRENHARKVYLQVLDRNYHLFLPFILAISPRGSVDLKIEELFQHDWDHVQIDDSTKTKELIESIAVKRTFSHNLIYIRFMKFIFSTDTPQQEDFEQHLLADGTSNDPDPQIQGQGQATSLVSLTGDVYELTVEDARMVVMSDQILGKIWLTDTYEENMNTPSFVTIPISEELTNQFTTQRPRVM